MIETQRIICSLFTVASALLALGLIGCGDQDATAHNGTAPTETMAVKLVMGFSQIGAESDWRRANTNSIKSAAESSGVDLHFADAQQKQENQIKAIRSFIAQQVDVIAFSPVVTTGWEPVLQEAKRAKIPVLLTDRSIEVSDPSLYLAMIGSNFVEEGERAGQWLAKKTAGTAIIAELEGTPGSAPAIDRHKGFAQAISTFPGMKVIKSQSGEFTRSKGKEVMEAFLKSADGSSITAVFAHNDDMALGAIQAIEESGKVPGKDIIIVSIDGVKTAFEAMVAGKLNCTVECNPLIGNQLMDAAKKAKAGTALPRWIKTEEGVFDQSTAAEAIKTRQY